jgi:hypothetical protein
MVITKSAMADLPGVGVGEGGRLLGSLVLKVSRGRKPQATFPRPAIHSGFMETESSVIDLLQALQQTLIKRMRGIWHTAKYLNTLFLQVYELTGYPGTAQYPVPGIVTVPGYMYPGILYRVPGTVLYCRLIRL